MSHFFTSKIITFPVVPPVLWYICPLHSSSLLIFFSLEKDILSVVFLSFLQRTLYKRVVSRIPTVRRQEKLPCLRGRAVYSVINFWSHLSPSIKHLAEYYSRECRARLFPTRWPASFRGSRFIAPPRVYRRVNHCARSNASASFYLAVACSFTASKHIALAGKCTQFQGRCCGRKTAFLRSIYRGFTPVIWSRLIESRFIGRYLVPSEKT